MILDSLLGAGAAAPIDALGKLFDKLFTSDEERLQAQAVLDKLKAHPAELQVELNKIEAAHRSVFVAGWRPAVGWICAAGIGWAYLGHPLFLWAAALWFPGTAPPAIDTDGLYQLVLAMLGMAGLRSFEKTTGKTK